MAARFWVGGTGTWDASDTTHWSTTTGGGGGASVPGSSDAATFDGSSGGGTVTVYAGPITIQSITMGAFTGTLDFATNNPNVTLTATGGLSGTGSGTRTLNMGSGTWTFTSTGTATPLNFATVTNLTFSGASSVVVLPTGTASRRTLSLGTLTWGTITIAANSSGGAVAIGNAATIGTLNITGPNVVTFPNAATTTISNAITWTGAVSTPIGILSNSDNTVATLAVATASTVTGCVFRLITFTGAGAKVANNSIDLGLNTGVTITNPSGGMSRARGAGGF